MKSKKPKILYICNSENLNENFFKFLKKTYNAKLYYGVIPSSIEKCFGNLNFHVKKGTYDMDSDWSWHIALWPYTSTKEIQYKFGFNLEEFKQEEKTLEFKRHLRKYLLSLGLKFSDNEIISNILNQPFLYKRFIKESQLNNFDLIIVDNVAHIVDKDYLNETNNRNPYFKNPDENYEYLQYIITPEILHNLLKINKKLFFLMNREMDSIKNNHLKYLNEILRDLHLASFEISSRADIEENLSFIKLHGIDLENYFSDDLSEFPITINENNLTNYKYLFENVKNLHISLPFQLIPFDKDGIIDYKKVLLSGNCKTTKLCRYHSYYPFNKDKDKELSELILSKDFEKISKFPMKLLFEVPPGTQKLSQITYTKAYKYDEISKQIHKTIFGVISTDERNIYCSMTGGLNTEICFNDKTCDNKIFIQNIIDCLLNQVETDSLIDEDLLPKIEFTKSPPTLKINNKEISLSNTEYCYYLYFLQRAKEGNGFIDLSKEDNPEFKKDDIIPRISSDIIKRIIELYNDLFKGSRLNHKLVTKYKKDKSTPFIDTEMPTILSNVKKAILEKLKNTIDEESIEKIIIKKKKMTSLYGIELSPKQITIE